MTHIDALLRRLKDSGMRASAWRGTRIYLNGRGSDIKAYIAFDDPQTPEEDLISSEMGLFSGCVLKVYSEADQNSQWLRDRAKQVKHDIMRSLVYRKIVPGPVCEKWEDVIL